MRKMRKNFRIICLDLGSIKFSHRDCMITFLHTFNPNPILFQIGWFKIHWYGFFVVLGIILGLLAVLKLAKRLGVKSDEVFNLGFYVIIFGLLGARIYAVFLDLGFYLDNPFEIIAVWHGGLAIHGAVIGGAIAGLIYCFKNRQSFWKWADITAPAIALGQAVGRWGNYFNQELFGRPTDLPWGIPIAFESRPLEYLSEQYFQPTFIYESMLNLLNFAVLVLVFLWTKKRNQESGIRNYGIVFLVYLINYSLIRIAMEFLRIDQTPVIFGLKWPMLASGLIFILSAGGLVFLRRRISYNFRA